MEKKVRMVCSSCGGENIHADSYAEWNVEKQEWEVDNVFFKNGFCDDCDGECSIDEVEIKDGEILIPVSEE